MNQTRLPTMLLLLAFSLAMPQANAAGLGKEIGRLSLQSRSSLVVPVAQSALTNGEKRILRGIRSHSKKMKSLNAKMDATIKRVKRTNTRLKR